MTVHKLQTSSSNETNLGATKAWAPAAQATAITADFILEFRRWREKLSKFQKSDESLSENEGVGGQR